MENATPGTWWGAYGSGEYAGKVWINILCPKCKRGMSIKRGDDGHKIDPKGVVSPSVVCPHPGCGWHVFVVLSGWPL